MKQWYLLLVLIVCELTAKAQDNRTADSTMAANTLLALVNIASKPNNFYKAAPYIIYRGSDAKRRWKTFCNYQLNGEKQHVDDICKRIHSTLCQSEIYTILRYVTETESEGTWHALEVQFTDQRGKRTAQFAFLKIGKRFGLGDIDE